MSIYKVFRVIDNIISEGYVYLGNNDMYDASELNSLYEKEPNNIVFSKIMGEEFITMIEETPVKLTFLNEFIYDDDTIEIIKYKLMKLWNVCFEELYLFCKQLKKFNSVDVYNNANKNSVFSKSKIISLFQNYTTLDISSIEIQDKDYFDYNDLFSLNADNKLYEFNKPIGISYKQHEEFITINPFSVSFLDENVIVDLDSYLQTNNHMLLFNSAPILNNTLYVCIAEDVYQYCEKSKLSTSSISKVYFPYLHQENIFTTNLIYELRKKIKIDKNFEKYNKSIDILHKIYEDKSDTLSVSKEGITYIEFVIYSKAHTELPLDLIFISY